MKSQAAIQKVLDDEAKSYGGVDNASDASTKRKNNLYDKSASSSPFPDDNNADPKSLL